MNDEYPYSELQVYIAGYERGRSFARASSEIERMDDLVAEELASRRLSMYDLTREGLMMLGLEAEFVPREVFDAAVRRALEKTI